MCRGSHHKQMRLQLFSEAANAVSVTWWRLLQTRGPATATQVETAGSGAQRWMITTMWCGCVLCRLLRPEWTRPKWRESVTLRTILPMNQRRKSLQNQSLSRRWGDHHLSVCYSVILKACHQFYVLKWTRFACNAKNNMWQKIRLNLKSNLLLVQHYI